MVFGIICLKPFLRPCLMTCRIVDRCTQVYEGVVIDIGSTAAELDGYSAAVIKGRYADGICIPAELKVFQVLAAAESPTTDTRTGGNIDFLQFGAAFKGTGVDICNAVRNAHLLQIDASFKHTFRNFGVSATQCCLGQGGAFCKYIPSDEGHCAGDIHLCQCGPAEGILMNFGDAVGKGVALHVAAFIECKGSNGGHALFHNDGCDAVFVCIPGFLVPNPRHRALAGNGHNTVRSQFPCHILSAGAAGCDLCSFRKDQHRTTDRRQCQYQQNTHHFLNRFHFFLLIYALIREISSQYY